MPQPIHILHLINTLEIGGAEKRLVEIIEALAGEAFRFTVVCLRHAGRFEARTKAAGALVQSLGYRPMRESGRLRLSRLFEPLAAMRRFQAALDHHRPDAVHSWLPISNVIAGRAMARWRYRHMALIASRVVTGEYGENNPLIPLIEMLAARRADLVYCNSRTVCDDVVAREPALDPANLRMIRNGVDMGRFHPAEDRAALRQALGWTPDSPIVLSVGALRPGKAQAQLIDAAPLVLRHVPAARFVLAGADQGEGERLSALAALRRVDPRVEFLGAREDVPALMQGADLLVLPSALEGLPNVLLEAQSCALPCVAAQLPGCIEALGEGHAGLVAPGDPQALGEAIIVMLKDAATRRKVAQAGVARVRQAFSREAMLTAFAALYREAARLRK